MKMPSTLLVDDEVSFLKTLSKRLAKRDVETMLASSGEACLETLKKNPNIDVVVLDVKMPGMDGLETLKRIKKDHPLIEVIMLTGHATVESGIKGMKLGANDFLLKPCDIEELINKIKEALTT